MALEAMDPLLGRVVGGKYRIDAVLGRGGMGKVYRAEQVPLGRQVALKVLSHRGSPEEVDPAFQRRFFLEASLCSKLSHPNIVTIYDYGRIEELPDESYFMAMEYLPGQTLYERLRRSVEHRLTAQEAVRICGEIARGLREAHRAGVVHRDLKPGNVMLVPDEETGEKVKILDFGLVKQFEGDDKEDLTKEGSFLGSPKYMAPEQVTNQGIDHRTDLYSLGVILYQTLTGRVPFEEAGSMHTLLAHVQKAVPAMRERNPHVQVPASLESIVMKLLSKRQEDRFASAEDLLKALRMVQKEQGWRGRSDTGELSTTSDSLPKMTATSLPSAVLPAVPAPTMTEVPVAAPAGSRAPLVVGLVGVLLLGGIGVVFGMRNTTPNAGATTSVAPMVRPTMHIDSAPSGATVTELGRVLGVTPLAIDLDPAATATRSFVLALAGHRPHTLEQPPVRESVRHSVGLVPEQPAQAIVPPTPAVVPSTPEPRDSRTPRNVRPRPTPRPGTPAPSGTGLDIRIQR